jgi:hypothetical protein
MEAFVFRFFQIKSYLVNVTNDCVSDQTLDFK